MSLTPTAQAWSHSLSTVHHRRDNIFTKILRALRRLRGRPDAPPTSRRSSISHYDPNNIFARILRGEIPCHKVYEDENALVFLDIRPRAPGHTVVLTKAPLRTILDCEPEHLVQVMQIAQHIARAAMQVFAVDGITIQQCNESAGAQTVPHLHVHVIPRITGVPLEPPNGKTEKVEVLADQAARLAAAIKPAAFKEIPLFSRDALLDYARQIERRP